MHAHKLKVTIQEDHRVELQLPDDFPEGPAKIIVLTNRTAGDAQPSPASPLSEEQWTLAALAELRSVQLTSEEEGLLDALPRFQIRAFVDGLQPGIDPDKMNPLLDQLEAEDVVRKLRG